MSGIAVFDVKETTLDFGTAARGAMATVAAGSGRTPPPGRWDRVRRAIGSVPAYPDVRPGLEHLRDAGWTLVSLTHSAPAAVQAQLSNAGLTGLFDHVLSVDAARAFKPAAAPYRHAADILGADTKAMWMVACQDWDLAWARSAGMRTAFVTRPAVSYASVYELADLIVADFEELADALVATPGNPV